MKVIDFNRLAKQMIYKAVCLVKKEVKEALEVMALIETSKISCSEEFALRRDLVVRDNYN